MAWRAKLFYVLHAALHGQGECAGPDIVTTMVWHLSYRNQRPSSSMANLINSSFNASDLHPSSIFALRLPS